MYCEKCGNILKNNDKFCSKCGCINNNNLNADNTNIVNKNLEKKPTMFGSYGYGLLVMFNIFCSCLVTNLFINLSIAGINDRFYEISNGLKLFSQIVSIIQTGGSILTMFIGGLIIYAIRNKLYDKYGKNQPKLYISILIGIAVNIVCVFLGAMLNRYFTSALFSLIYLIILLSSFIIIHMIRLRMFKRRNSKN